MIAAFSPGSDFKRYYRGRMPRLAVAVIILMHCCTAHCTSGRSGTRSAT